MLTLFIILLIVAMVCAFLALAEIPSRINVTALGLFFAVAALLIRTVG